MREPIRRAGDGVEAGVRALNELSEAWTEGGRVGAGGDSTGRGTMGRKLKGFDWTEGLERMADSVGNELVRWRMGPGLVPMLVSDGSQVAGGLAGRGLDGSWSVCVITKPVIVDSGRCSVSSLTIVTG